jgi:3-phenylpropionate/trans-cinnamate dioxygenase ferredoxin subunit
MADWREVATVGAIEEDEGHGVTVGDLQIGIYLVDGAYFACDNVCPHGAALLSDGYQEDGEIECPLHQGRFDIRTGEPTSPPVDCPIRVYPVKVEDEVLLVDIATE